MEYKVGNRVRVINPGQASYVEGKQHWKEGDEVEVLFLNQYNKELIYIGNKGDDWTKNKACFRTKGLELIKEDTMETQVKPVYKVVRIEDGRYYSIYCGSEVAPNFETQLEYTIGEVTKSPTGSEGIFCYTTKEQAIRDYIEFHYITRSSKPLAILECYPTGTMGGSPIQPKPEGVYVKAEVWREEEPRPEPKFKVGNRVIISDAHWRKGETFIIASIEWEVGHPHWHYYSDVKGFTPADECWLELAPQESRFKAGDRVRLIDTYGVYSGVTLGMVGTVTDPTSVSSTVVCMPANSRYYVQQKYLELAPVEEWVDVTKECTLTMSRMEGRVSVRHNGSERLLLGSKGATLWVCQDGQYPEANYKVEFTGGAYSCGAFKVLKLVKH